MLSNREFQWRTLKRGTGKRGNTEPDTVFNCRP